jgi:5-formyltetrahydrofolate cyclo-ligase
MAFFSYYPGDLLIKNHYGILEPDPKNSKICSPENLDLVLVPLLAFDNQHNRLGMGGGYYDKTFAFLKNSKNLETKIPSKPYLLGLAYSFQYQTKLPLESWDIPIDDVWVLEVGLKNPGDVP